MKLHWKNWWLILAVVALVGACDDSASNETDNGSGSDLADSTQPDTSDQIENDVAVQNAYLEVFSPSDDYLKIFYNSDANIEVGYFEADGTAITNANLDFAITASTNGCHQTTNCISLDAFSGTTGPDGHTTMRVKSGESTIDAIVTVSVPGMDSVDPVEIPVVISPKDTYELLVRFEYDGARTFYNSPDGTKQMLKARLQPQSSCSELYTPPLRNVSYSQQDHYQELPTAQQVRDTERHEDGTFQDVLFYALKTGEAYIAMGYAETASGLVTVYGCSEESSATTDTITVQLVDTPILVDGTYKLTSNFDLLSGLPRRDLVANPEAEMEAGDWVDIIINLFSAPGETLYGLIGPYIEDFSGFDIPDGLESVVGDLIDDAIENFAPDWLGNTLVIGGDIADFVTSMRLLGEFVVDGEPNADGIIADGQIHRYNAVSLRWRLPCAADDERDIDECNANRLSYTFAELGRADLAIEGTWGGAVAPCTDDPAKQCLVINSHGLTVPYGEIALAVIEGKLLALLLDDPTIDSLERFVDQVFLNFIIEWYNEGKDPADQVPNPDDAEQKCESVGQILANLASLDGIVGDAIQSIGTYACNEGKSYLVTLIREQAAKLTVNTEDNLQLGTSGSCVIMDSDENLEYDLIGESVPDSARCNWGIRFQFNEESNVVDLNGLFHAKRGGF